MDLSVFAIYLLACMAAASTGTLFPPDGWWKTINKPWFTPPDWVFPVAWLSIYLMSAIAAARIAGVAANEIALALWALQIALNALWSPVFFGLHRPKAGLFIVLSLWVIVLVTMLAFWSLDTVAGILMAPYLFWLTVASALNGGVVLMNPGKGSKDPPTPAE